MLYCLFAKRLILDGWPGIYYTLQRVYAELVLSLKLVDARLRRRAVSSAVEQLPSPAAKPARENGFAISADTGAESQLR